MRALAALTVLLGVALGGVPVAGLAASGGEQPEPPVPTTSTGTTSEGGGFDTGAGQGGQDGENTPGTTTPPPPPPPPRPGTWTKQGQACATGGTGTCTEFVICPDGSRANYWVKTFEGEIKESGDFCPGEEPTNTPPIDPREELKKVLLPEAVIAVQPPEGETLVNLPTIFSTAALTYTAPPLDVLGQKVVFTLTPATFVWHHGDGTKQTTDTAGKKYEDGDEPTALINHLYLETATDLAVSVDITWSATWALNGEDQGPVDSTVTKVGTAQELDVLEARPTLVN